MRVKFDPATRDRNFELSDSKLDEKNTSTLTLVTINTAITCVIRRPIIAIVSRGLLINDVDLVLSSDDGPRRSMPVVR